MALAPLDDFVIDYESYFDHYLAKREWGTGSLTHFPQDDLIVIRIPKSQRSVLIVDEPLSDCSDPHVANCINCYEKEWSCIQRNYIKFSLWTNSKSDTMRILCDKIESSLEVEQESALDSPTSDFDKMDNWSSVSSDLSCAGSDKVLPDIFTQPPQEEDKVNKIRRSTNRLSCLFAFDPPKECNEPLERRHFPLMPTLHTGHRILVKCLSLKLELEIEPIFANMAIYDAKEKKKISENFYFDMNSEALKKMLGSHSAYQDVSTLSRSAIFEVTYPSTDLYLVVRLEKVLQGDVNDVLAPYMKEDHTTERLRSHAISYCERLGKYRMPLAWTAINMMDIVGGDKDRETEGKDGTSSHGNTLERNSTPSDDVKKKNLPSSSYRRGSLDRRSFNEKNSTYSSEELGNLFHSFRPVTLTVSTFFKQENDKMKDDDLYRFLPDLKKPSSQLKRKCLPGQLQLDIAPIQETPKYCLSPELWKVQPHSDGKCRPVKEIAEFPSTPVLKPHLFYRNLLFVSPKNLNFTGRPGSARNLAIKIEYMSSEGVAEPFIFGRSSCPEFTKEAFAVVSYHNKYPDFYDEFKIKLPTSLTDHHLFFTFYHVTCQKKQDDKPLETALGYTWMPIHRNGSLQTGEHLLPVMIETPPANYSYISPDIQLPGTKWIDNHKGIFSLTLKALSTVHSQDNILDNFFLLIKMIEEKQIPARIGEANMENELKNSMRDLHNAEIEPLVQFMPIILDRLINLMVEPPIICSQPANLSQNCFETFSAIVNTICNALESKNDQHGRNGILLSYIGFQATLPRNTTRSSSVASMQNSATIARDGNSLFAPFAHARRSTSNPDICSEGPVYDRSTKPLDRTCSMRSGEKIYAQMPDCDYPNVTINRSNGSKSFHEELIFQWMVSTGSLRQSANESSWFFFELVLKSMHEYVSTLESDIPRKFRFPVQFYDDLGGLIMSLANDVISLASQTSPRNIGKRLNCSVAFFLVDLLSVIDRGMVFCWIYDYRRHLNTTPSYDNEKILIAYKLDLVRIVCSHEHYVPLNLPCSMDFSTCSPIPSDDSNTSQTSLISTNFGHDDSNLTSLSPRFCKQHFLVGLVLQDITVSLRTKNIEMQQESVATLHNILTNHDFDDRLQTADMKAKVAYMYLPIIDIIIEHLPMLHNFGTPKVQGQSDADTEKAQVHSAISQSIIYGIADSNGGTGHQMCRVGPETTRILLFSLLWVLKNVEEDTLQKALSKLSQRRLDVFLNSLHIAQACIEFKHNREGGPLNYYRHKDLRSKLEEAIMGQNTARSEMMLRRKDRLPSASSTPGSSHNASMRCSEQLRWRKDSFNWKSTTSSIDGSFIQDDPKCQSSQNVKMTELLSSELSIIILDTLETIVKVILENDHLQGLVTALFRVVLDSLSGVQSTRTCIHILNSQKALVSKFPTLLFDEETELCGDLCLQLLKYCSSSLSSIRRHSSASLYMLMRHNFEIGNNFSRAKMQITTSLSSLVGTSQICNERFLKMSLKTILSYAEEDIQLAETVFPEQVKDLVFNLHMILSDTVKMRECFEDPEMLLDLMHRIARGYQSSPHLRLTWLANMAQKHIEREQHAEAAMCFVHSAALVAEYLYMLDDKKYLPIGAVSFERISPNTLQESAVSDDVMLPDEEEICSGKYFSENGLVGLLEQASASFNQAGLFECINEVYKLLVPISEKQRDWKSLSTIHSKINDAFLKIDHLEGKRVFGSYFRVGFYGNKFDDLDGEEFIYKEPALTKLAEISHRLEVLFVKRFGAENFEIIKDSNTVNLSRLQPNKAYIQITYVEPHFEIHEHEDRITCFERNHNINKFIFSTPFTTDGRAHGDLHEQFKRKTILTTENMFPYIKTRIGVVERQSWVLTPIEVAIEDIQKKTLEIVAALKQEPPDMKILPMVLQGCLGTTVNQGPMEIAHVFLQRNSSGQKASKKLQNKLRLCFKDFSRRCYEALKKNKTLMTSEMREYQRELERNYHHFVEKINPLIMRSIK